MERPLFFFEEITIQTFYNNEIKMENEQAWVKKGRKK